jgi:hypothetical protein
VTTGAADTDTPYVPADRLTDCLQGRRDNRNVGGHRAWGQLTLTTDTDTCALTGWQTYCPRLTGGLVGILATAGCKQAGQSTYGLVIIGPKGSGSPHAWCTDNC